MAALLSCIALILPFVSSLPLNSPRLSSYDYIVVGGGPAGLTVANRLSEDPSVTVLLLEAGPADQGERSVQVPFFVGHTIGGVYDWNLTTTPQTFLDGNPRNLPQGRVLGGGTILNAMLWNRGGREDYDDWVTLGNPGWGWNDMLPYFQKSETFTPYPNGSTARRNSINFDPSVHGYSGPVNVSYSQYVFNQTANLFEGLHELGIPIATDPNSGDIAGASYLPVDIDPVNQTRSSARTAYFDPYVSRPNLWIVTGQTATQILFEGFDGNSVAESPINGDSSVGQGNSPQTRHLFGNTSRTNVTQAHSNESRHDTSAKSLLIKVKRWFGRQTRQSAAPIAGSSPLRAIGVECASNAASKRQNISATREVIVCAGAIHSPQLLQLSGIGPATELQQLRIPVAIDLPGVGSNLQDHYLVGVSYPYQNRSSKTSAAIFANSSLMLAAQKEYYVNGTGPWTSGPPDGNAFPPLSLVTQNSDAIALTAQSQNSAQYLATDSHPSVTAGFEAQLKLLAIALRNSTRASYELLNTNYGSFSVANMRPLSRGTIKLQSANPFTPPLIDPRYGSNPVDLQILLEAIKFNRKLLATESMKMLQPLQLIPTVDASDSVIMDLIKSGIQTEYHPSCSCPMLPRNFGGVVDSKLLVYGTANLRIVDASIMPMIPASHLQAVMYGIAEKAADVIKGANLNTSSGTIATTMTASLNPSNDGPVVLANSSYGNSQAILVSRTLPSDSILASNASIPSSTTNTPRISTHLSILTRTTTTHSNTITLGGNSSTNATMPVFVSPFGPTTVGRSSAVTSTRLVVPFVPIIAYSTLQISVSVTIPLSTAYSSTSTTSNQTVPSTYTVLSPSRVTVPSAVTSATTSTTLLILTNTSTAVLTSTSTLSTFLALTSTITISTSLMNTSLAVSTSTVQTRLASSTVGSIITTVSTTSVSPYTTTSSSTVVVPSTSVILQTAATTSTLLVTVPATAITTTATPFTTAANVTVPAPTTMVNTTMSISSTSTSTGTAGTVVFTTTAKSTFSFTSTTIVPVLATVTTTSAVDSTSTGFTVSSTNSSGTSLTMAIASVISAISTETVSRTVTATNSASPMTALTTVSVASAICPCAYLTSMSAVGPASAMSGSLPVSTLNVQSTNSATSSNQFLMTATSSFTSSGASSGASSSFTATSSFASSAMSVASSAVSSFNNFASSFANSAASSYGMSASSGASASASSFGSVASSIASSVASAHQSSANNIASSVVVSQPSSAMMILSTALPALMSSAKGAVSSAIVNAATSPPMSSPRSMTITTTVVTGTPPTTQVLTITSTSSVSSSPQPTTATSTVVTGTPPATRVTTIISTPSSSAGRPTTVTSTVVTGTPPTTRVTTITSAPSSSARPTTITSTVVSGTPPATRLTTIVSAPLPSSSSMNPQPTTITSTVVSGTPPTTRLTTITSTPSSLPPNSARPTTLTSTVTSGTPPMTRTITVVSTPPASSSVPTSASSTNPNGLSRSTVTSTRSPSVSGMQPSSATPARNEGAVSRMRWEGFWSALVGAGALVMV